MEHQDLIFRLIGSDPHSPPKDQIPDGATGLFDFAFKNRVGLLLLERAVQGGQDLPDDLQEHLERLRERKEKTEAVTLRLASALDEVAEGEWTLFKSLKPFPSTPNDTDWFPLRRDRHAALCKHLLQRGFEFLEEAPLQVTLIEASGRDAVHSDKRGGTYYIDCYRAPGADYFIYMDPGRLADHVEGRELGGRVVPTLSDVAELAMIAFHNVFPERTYSIESFYLFVHYLQRISDDGKMDALIDFARAHAIEPALSANLAVTAALHTRYFGTQRGDIAKLLEHFGTEREEAERLRRGGFSLPYNFSNGCFFRCFGRKLKDPVSLRSAGVQAVHMLNPFFLFDVIRVLRKRLSKGGNYEQM